MKALLCTLILGLVFSTTVHSLRCYTCVDGDCKTETQCPAESNFCKTVSTPDELKRTCEEICIPGVNTYCCMSDLCE
ncbi:lymphocyte antigen 6D [Engraulis encrasicolus]|uniref:lymphocyte antigen 6D n=1 Tax=Engraulis encrasicolus TaxID=184585 RepID=UPI002FD43A00